MSKKLILFCGRNSTGKTYASYVLQAFLADGAPLSLKCFPAIIEQIKQKGSFKIQKSYIEEWIHAKCDSVISNKGIVFGISDTTCNKLFSSFSLHVDYRNEDYDNSVDITFNRTISEGSLYWKFSKLQNSEDVTIESNGNVESMSTPNGIRTISLICNIIFRCLAFGAMSNVRMLTVERNSIYTFKTELSLSRNELIDHIQQQSDKSEIDIVDILNKSSRRYPQAVRSSLRIANDLENVQKYTSPFSSVADMIEKNILNGEVSMTKNGDVEFHAKNMPKTKHIPFHLSSSIVKTMASLIIYLRHIANMGDTLIIDEPEMNFHPDVQILLARIFAILTSKGLRLVISTHSDYIVREFNNLIMAEAISTRDQVDIVKGFKYQKEMLLNHSDVSVLYFEQIRKKTVTATSLDIDEEGFEVRSIDDAINSQNMMAECLYATLTKNKD